MKSLDDLLVFAKVVETSGFTSAAEALGLSKSQVSKQVKSLEDRLGARLLERTTRHVRPTEAGAAYYDRVCRALREIEDAEEGVMRLQEVPRGRLRASVPVSLGLGVLAGLSAEFMERWPELQLELEMSDRRVDLLEEGFDLAIRVGRLEDSGLVARRLGSTELWFVASPGWVARRGRPRSLADIRPEDALVHSYTDPVWRLGNDSLRAGGRLIANSGEALLRAAEAGLGVVLLPDFVPTQAIASGRVVRLFEDKEAPQLPIHALWPHSRHLSPKVRVFVDFLTERLATLGGRG